MAEVNESRRRRVNEPDWLTGDLGDYKFCSVSSDDTSDDKHKPVQQGDLLKPLFKDIIAEGKHGGLEYAAKRWKNYINIFPNRQPKSQQKVQTGQDLDADVIIVGAGMSGLVAAYELSRAKVKVMVLEQTTRVGGRVFTLGEKDGLAKHLYGEAGAMRLPCKYDIPYTDMTHYLTDFYINKFGLPKAEFLNKSDNTWLSFYDKGKKRVSGWTDDDFNELWPGCYKNIDSKVKPKINNIDEYYSRTTSIVQDQLRTWLAEAEKSSKDPIKVIKAKAWQWERWINIWSQFSLVGFLQNTYEAILTKIKKDEDQDGLSGLEALLPWPDIAVRGYSVFSYTQQLDQSLVEYLRYELGEWWQSDMHRIQGGMSRLPEAFANWLPPTDLEPSVPVSSKSKTKPTDDDFNDLWSGCYKNIHPDEKPKINNIGDYYSHTTNIVKDQLRTWLVEAEKSSKDPNEIIKENARQRERWIKIWSPFSLIGFLQNTYEAILTKIEKEEDKVGLSGLKALLPWPDIAVRRYSEFSSQQLHKSLVTHLQCELDTPDLEPSTPVSSESNTKLTSDSDSDDPLHRNIHFNHTVNTISYSYHAGDPASDYVTIDGFFTNSGRPFPTIKGKAVIVTTAVNIIRSITFQPIKPQQNQPPTEFFQAIEDIFTAPSTKIFIQTKTRFWEHGKNPILGGFSKTNLPIGQLHYPSNRDKHLDDKTKKGLLLVYTWKTEALLFGAQHPDTAVREAVEQIATIHPEIKHKGQFELGLVHAWYSQPSTQGAYGLLKPNQFKNVQWLYNPMYNVFFGGEALSFAAGWIQGALESGLKAAYQYYIRYENAEAKRDLKLTDGKIDEISSIID